KKNCHTGFATRIRLDADETLPWKGGADSRKGCGEGCDRVYRHSFGSGGDAWMPEPDDGSWSRGTWRSAKRPIRRASAAFVPRERASRKRGKAGPGSEFSAAGVGIGAVVGTS